MKGKGVDYNAAEGAGCLIFISQAQNFKIIFNVVFTRGI